MSSFHMDPKDRSTLAKAAAAGLRAFAARPEPAPVLVGFDGFVDSIISVVDKRQGVEDYTAIPTIADFGARVSAKAGQSSNYELVTKLEKLGGNGPIMANALCEGGADVTYIGALGHPAMHPVFVDFGTRARVYSVAEPGFTDALEFDDGKLMLGKYTSISGLDRATVEDAMGPETFAQVVRESRLIGATNWTMLNRIESVWEAIGEALESTPGGSPRPYLFVDLADPAKRTDDDLRGVLSLLGRLQSSADVVLGLNLSEAGQVGKVLGLSLPSDPQDAEASIELTAAAIRGALNLTCCVVHPRRGAAAAILGADGAVQTAAFAGPFVAKPKLSTGAGDNFNGGFCLGLLAGLDLVQCLCTGVGVSGFYVRNARSPKLDELADFCDDLPPAG